MAVSDELRELNTIWQEVMNSFAEELPVSNIDLWVRPLVLKSFENNVIHFECDSAIKTRVISERHIERIKRGFASFLGFEPEVVIDYVPTEKSPSIQGFSHVVRTFEKQSVADNPACLESERLSRGRETERSPYNPLFIYGPSGLGKTHLLHAIINRIKNNIPDVKILYVKCEDFTNQLIEHLSRNAMAEFKNKYRKCDVLLIDDIQFLAGKNSTQEEFFHTFNALYEENKQIILTSDRPQKEINDIEDRLLTRFVWGLTVDISSPEFETRLAIIKRKADNTSFWSWVNDPWPWEV